jgi:acetyl esterase/lipase
MRRRIVTCPIVLLLLVIAVAAISARAGEVEYTPDITYATVDGQELKLDIASPKGLARPTPAIVVIHGGGWMYGRRQEMAPVARQLAAHGYVAATISYRLIPKYRFPAQIEDVKAAVRYLRAHAGELNIDRTHLGATGISAGAHLAMMLGVMDTADGLEGTGGNADQSSKVQAVVSFVGPVNLVFPNYNTAQSQIIAAFVNGPPAEKVDECRRASPITYIDPGDAAFLCFFGTDDPLVPFDQAFEMAKALDDAHLPGRIEILIGARHGWVGKELERTMAAAIAFFDEQLGK